MKRLLTLGTVVFLALPLAADEKGKSQTERKKTETAEQKAQQPVADSPLVAAAKRSKRASSKTVVINDETVKNATGHVTSTTIEHNPVLPEQVAPSLEEMANQKRADERAAEEKKTADAKAAEAKRQNDAARRARMAGELDEYEGGYDDDMDPARIEGAMSAAAEKANEKKPN